MDQKRAEEADLMQQYNLWIATEKKLKE